MTLSLFNRYGIYPSSAISSPIGPIGDLIVDASSLGLSNGDPVNSYTMGAYTLSPLSTSPTYNSTGINGHPSIQFSGTDMMKSTTGISDLNNTDYSLYMIGTTTANGNSDQHTRIITPGSTSNGAWIVNNTFGGTDVRALTGGSAAGIDEYDMTGKLQFLVSTRVDLSLGRKSDMVSLETPELRTSETVFQAPGSANFHEFIFTPSVFLSGAGNADGILSSASTLQFGELRIHTSYLSDQDHEDTIQELLAKWR